MTHCDYLRLASWELTTYTTLAAILRSTYPGDWDPGAWMQYKGFRSPEGIFYGSGEQSGDRHHIFQASGQNAMSFFDTVWQNRTRLDQLYCTRIDLQQTIKMPAGLDLRAVYRANTNRAKTIIESDSKTVYIGRRESDSFTRLYQKLDRQYLRLEHEFKGKQARMIFDSAMADVTPQSVFQYSFIKRTQACKFGSVVTKHYDLRKDKIMSLSDDFRAEFERNLKRKMAWLTSVEVGLLRYLGDDDLRGPARRIIKNLNRAIELQD